MPNLTDVQTGQIAFNALLGQKTFEGKEIQEWIELGQGDLPVVRLEGGIAYAMEFYLELTVNAEEAVSEGELKEKVVRVWGEKLNWALDYYTRKDNPDVSVSLRDAARKSTKVFPTHRGGFHVIRVPADDGSGAHGIFLTALVSVAFLP